MAPSSSTRTILVIVTALVLDLVGFACILPSFPQIMQYYEAEAAVVRPTSAHWLIPRPWAHSLP